MNSNSQGIWIKECRILVILCALAFLAPGSPLNADAQRPNILIIFTDDQGYADLGCYGNTKNRTPRLDQLAKEGTRFTSFYSQTVCGPSRSALLTGRQPIRSGGSGMPASKITLAELIRKAGYQTACIGKWDVSNRKPIIERMPNAQGFDYYFGTLGANDGGGVAFHENNERAGNTRDMGSLTRLYTDKAIDFLIYLITANPNPEIQRRASQRMMDFEEGLITEIEARGKLSELKSSLRQKVNQAKHPSETVYSLRVLAEIASRTEDWDQAVFANTRLVEGFHDLRIKLQAYQRLAEVYRQKFLQFAEKEDFKQATMCLRRIIELAPHGIMIPETMLKLAHFQWEQESKNSDTYKILRQLVERYPGTEEGREAGELLEQFE